MISVDQRILLVFTALIVVLVFAVRDLFVVPHLSRRCGNFLKLMVALFPLIDLKMPPSDLDIKLLEASIALFLVLNLTSFVRRIVVYLKRPALLFVVVLFALAVISSFPGYSVFAVLRFSMLLLLLVVIWIALESGFNVFRSVLNGIVIWAFLFFVLQLVFGVDFTLYQSVNQTSLNDFRYTSFSQDPQKLGQVVFMLAIIYIGNLYLNKRGGKWDVLFALACIVMGFATGSRASLIGFSIVLLLMFMHRFNLKTVLLFLGSALGVYFLYDVITSLQVFERMNDFNDSFEGRLEIFWLKALEIFFEHPWTGVGPGNFYLYVSQYFNSFTYGPDGAVVDQPESGYLMWLTETGIIGTAFYLFFLIKALAKKTTEHRSRPYKLALVVWIFGFVSVYSLSDVKVMFLVLLCLAMLYQRSPDRVSLVQPLNADER